MYLVNDPKFGTFTNFVPFTLFANQQILIIMILCLFQVSSSIESITGAISSSDDPILLPIVVDGSNLAMSHGNKDVFSCKGIWLCVSWFQMRGHKDITVFVPKWRKESSRPDAPIRGKGFF
jgi:hypothetical protein